MKKFVSLIFVSLLSTSVFADTIICGFEPKWDDEYSRVEIGSIAYQMIMSELKGDSYTVVIDQPFTEVNQLRGPVANFYFVTKNNSVVKGFTIHRVIAPGLVVKATYRGFIVSGLLMNCKQ